jgi:hypothetical protein
MIGRISVVALTLLLAGPVGLAQGQDRPAEYAAAMRADCAKEMKSQCRGVKEGGGRVLACLYSHDSKLGAKCAATVATSVERLGEALGALANVRRVCDADAKRLCAGVMPGDGNLIDCLSQARKAVSQACNATLDTAFLRP